MPDGPALGHPRPSPLPALWSGSVDQPLLHAQLNQTRQRRCPGGSARWQPRWLIRISGNAVKALPRWCPLSRPLGWVAALLRDELAVLQSRIQAASNRENKVQRQLFPAPGLRAAAVFLRLRRGTPSWMSSSGQSTIWRHPLASSGGRPRRPQRPPAPTPRHLLRRC